MFQTVETVKSRMKQVMDKLKRTVKNNDFPLDFGKLHKRVNQLPGVFFPDHFLQKIGPGPGCVRCTGSLRFRAGLLPRKIGEAAVRRSLSAEVVITDISGYGQQVAFQVFAAADVHISDKTKKRLLRQIIRAVGIAGMVTAEAVNVIIILFCQQIQVFFIAFFFISFMAFLSSIGASLSVFHYI